MLLSPLEMAIILAGVGLAQAVAVISPGPSFLVVARTAVAHARAPAIRVAIGLGFGSVAWASAALAGLQVVFAAMPVLYLTIKIMGAGYLLYLAVMLWRHAREPLAMRLDESPPGKTMRSAAAIRLGLFTQLANPKVVVFFGSVFVALLPPAMPAAMVAALLAMVFAIEVTWYAFVACVLSVQGLRERYGRAKAAIDRVAGTCLALLGLSLLLDRS